MIAGVTHDWELSINRDGLSFEVNPKLTDDHVVAYLWKEELAENHGTFMVSRYVIRYAKFDWQASVARAVREQIREKVTVPS